MSEIPEMPRPGPAEAINHGAPTEPRLAATVLLLRAGRSHGSVANEVLMLRRGERARFMPGVWVFPGGRLEAGDGDGLDGLMRCARRELAEESSIELGADQELVPFSRWVTPEAVQTRFDTWFFLARAPAHCSPEADGFEMDRATWISPIAALEAHQTGQMSLVFPTVKQLEALAPHTNPGMAIEAARQDPAAVEPVLPKVVGSESEYRVLLPGDPGYPD